MNRPILHSYCEFDRRGAAIADKTDIEIRLDNGLGPLGDWAGLHLKVRAAIGVLRCLVARLDVMIVGDARMRGLHLKHKGQDTTTDVLTFDMSAQGGGVDAHIVVCLDEARRRAEEFNHPLEHELLLYMVHGLLHCCGYDDVDEAQAARMHAEEDRILTEIGVGAVYRQADSS